jgi:signal transduction histidine kinase
MSQTQPQPDPDAEMARLSALAANYEAKLTEAAALIMRIRHEINNPLAALLGQAQLLLRGELDEDIRKRVQTVEELAVRIKEIVAELRTVQTPVARVDRNQQG